MKFSVSYDKLKEVLDFPNVVISDKIVEEKFRNVIFMVRQEGVTVVGYNSLTFVKCPISDVEVVEVPEEGYDFQVKASDLNKLVSSFNNLAKTVVSGVDFELDGVRIKVTVHESPKKEEDTRYAQSCHFHLECPPIITNIKKEISIDFPESSDGAVSDELLLYLDSLFPLLVNDTSNGSGSKLNFAEDYVFVISSVASGFFKNKLPDSFKEISLGYSSINILKKLCGVSENILVGKLQNYICVQAENVEAFLRFQKVRPIHQMYIKRVNKDNGVVVDRLYLRDVLRRIGNMNSNGEMYIGEDLEFTNENFNQVIPIIKKKGNVDDIGVKISIPVIEKCILGSDTIFSENLFIYLIESGRGYSLVMSDSSGTWFSLVQVSKV